ncbi:beta-ketoacyl synthase N-terminal-like domain-containing protein [Sandaracinus amylolyticus]|uniref:Omega-3 polyunsaturated fatty acid synthase subunit, PfaB n=1 Tax=Sandaracinus amylolyticus TaxID=927083 RepID=A0A0F6SEH5_9BACT|nr:beta-ketoacyl synthase N-terminal-like domain-containing protein [Sandaracinus amylolyticus]AKF05204.1 omega-3 polyunsaturated fatty acid synthase subunit, PfaB [Sandaracinus amylolyticus]
MKRARFAPIAIVGRACVLPGALSPEALWELVAAGRDAITPAPEDRWGVRKEDVLGPANEPSGDRAWSDRGGYVRGFEHIFDPSGFGIDAREVKRLDPLFQWVLHTAREALRDANRLSEGRAKGGADRTGAILGNLSFPTATMSRYAASVWLEGTPFAPATGAIDPRNRFMSGLPAHLLSRALGVGGPRFALDAACASSLYAIALACDALHEGRADTMLAGAVNCADDLFIHVGFCALQAMSKTGRSRPFHPDADGLVPSEGAAILVLRRLDDALRDGERVLGVIRGVGLANDGRGRGLLAPSEDGQIRAMRAAWDVAGLDPSSVEYVECHATGTPVGDATEIRSMTRTFEGTRELPIGSLKANLGHLVTVAGAAGLMKVLSAFEHGTKPPTPHLDRTTSALDGTPLRVVRAPEPWTSSGPRRAAISAFGFGGNDAHLVVEEWRGQRIDVEAAAPKPRIAIVGVGARVGDGVSRADLASDLATGHTRMRDGAARAREVVLALEGLRFPPVDLQRSIAQQTLLLAAAREAATQVPQVRADRAAAIVGMGCDPEVARWGARWRLVEIAKREGWDEATLRKARDGIAPSLDAATVVGTMPNIPANRVNSQLDVSGASFTVSAEEASGVRALELARRALERREIDVAYVGAVDASAEPVHRRASDAVLGRVELPGDAAVVVVLMREDDARREGATVLAVIDDDARGEALALGDAGTSLAPLFGRAHAAWGLVHVAAGALAIHHGVRLRVAAGAIERWRERRAEIVIDALEGERSVIRLRAPEGSAPAPIQPVPAPSGPVLRLPAHPAPPRVDVLPVKPRMQRMDPAPSLPPILNGKEHHEPFTPAKPTAQPHAPAQAQAHARSPSPSPSHALAPSPSHALAPSPSHPPSPSHSHPPSPSPSQPPSHAPSPSPSSPHAQILARVAEHQRALGAMHRDFLAQQSALHEQFLRARQSAMFVLLGGAAAAPSVGSQPPSVVPATSDVRSQPPSVVPTSSDVRSQPPSVVPASSNVRSQPPSVVPASSDVRSQPPSVVPASSDVRSQPPSVLAAAPSVVSSAPAARPAAPTRSRALQPDPPRPPTGRSWSRSELEIHAGGRISEIFGELFAQQDEHAVQVRMPMEPMLLADRVVGIEAVPGILGRGLSDGGAAVIGKDGKGTVWTETDIRWDSWWLHEGRMPAGILIEAGQADLFLISYMGADFLNKGKRAYRLLGCELTYHRSPPVPGETIRYDIHVDGHANQGDVRLFFFHYDCRVVNPDGTAGEPVLTVRRGQAGFFTRAELDDSAGILWKPEEQEIVKDARVDAPLLPLARTTFEREHLDAFARGDVVSCFGPAFTPTNAHVRTPRIAGGRMLFFDRVDALDSSGGPWKRGYLKATRHITPDDWFFPGHFHNDPCMPGTLMFEGCLQALSFYLAAQGVTVERDGWRFEPVTGEPYKMLCRGQVVPESKELVYEVFVEEIHDGPIPTIYADLLCTVDGLGAFHTRRMGLRLVPDWPISQHPRLVAGDALPPAPGHEPLALTQADPQKPVARAPNGPSEGFPFDYASLLACAWGKPSTAFGKIYERFDGVRKVARLPGPPYHFMSRVIDVKGPMGEAKSGAEVTVDYDVPRDAWYFAENGAASMPMCVLMEAALQPCGWLASYVGCALTSEEDLLFRNLDGKGTLHAEVLPSSGTLRTHAKLKSLSKSGTMIIVAFDVRCTVGEQLVYTLDTVFGFFPKAAFENQAGLPISDAQRALFASGGDTVLDLRARPAHLTTGSAKLATPFLLMLDRVVHWDPKGGAKGLGALRAEKDVDPGEWFFKAHFFQDPVQPGSLGIEAMCQLLQLFMLETKMHEGMKRPRLEPIAVGKVLTWKYRGQVVPTNGVIGCTLEVTEVGRDERGAFAIADASLWVDGKRIYDAKNLGMRIVDDGDAPTTSDDGEETIDPASIADHCPTWVIPALPAMSMLDRIAAAAKRATGRDVIEVREMQIQRWITTASGPAKIRARVTPSAQEGVLDAVLEVFRDARDPRLSRFEPAATAKVRVGAYPAAPAPLAPLADARVVPSPYSTGQLFHGPTFQRQRELKMGRAGSSARLDASGKTGELHPIVLDAATHGVPHDAMESWDARIPPGRAAYPYRIERAAFFAAAPTGGEVRVEARAAGFDGHARVSLQLVTGDRVWCEIDLVEVLLPKGPIGVAPPLARQAFLRDRKHVSGVALAQPIDASTSKLDVRDLAASNWLPGTVERVYAIPSGRDVATEVAIKDHVARSTASHPSRVEVDGVRARSAHEPLGPRVVSVSRDETSMVVKDAAPIALDVAPIRAFWRERFGIGAWAGEDLFLTLIERFVRRVHLADPDAFAKIRGKSALFLANHQVGVESLLFGITISALNGLSTLTLAKKEHRDTWLGKLIMHAFAYPGVVDPRVIAYFDRSDPASLPTILGELGAMMRSSGKNVVIHVEGTRALSCAQPITKMSGVFVDMAITLGTPIVPVRFVGGLPREPLAERIEMPFGMGRQDYFVGAPIDPVELQAMPYKERTDRVLAAINALGPGHEREAPFEHDASLERAADERAQRTGAMLPLATISEVLASRASVLGPELATMITSGRAPSTGDAAKDAWLAELAAQLLGPRR